MTRFLRTLAAATALALIAVEGTAANKCVDAKGRVTYQDAACPSASAAGTSVDTSDALSTRPNRIPVAPSPAGKPAAPDSAYADAHGSWRGPAQFQLIVNGTREGSAQLVTAMVIELNPSGEVTGVVPQAGCRIKGLATQFLAPYIAQLDVSLQGCHEPRFNQRFNGHLTADGGSKEAKLSLTALTMPLLAPGRTQQVSLAAVLKR